MRDRFLAKRAKSFKDGEVGNETFLEAADGLLCDMHSMDVQLSRNAVTLQRELMQTHLEAQL